MIQAGGSPSRWDLGESRCWPYTTTCWHENHKPEAQSQWQRNGRPAALTTCEALRPQAQFPLRYFIGQTRNTDSWPSGHCGAKVKRVGLQKARIRRTSTPKTRGVRPPGRGHRGSPRPRRGPDGQGVSLGVEHVGVQAEQLWVVGEQQIQVLERLPQEEALHLVPGLGIEGILDVADGRIATRGDLHGNGDRGVRLQAPPAPQAGLSPRGCRRPEGPQPEASRPTPGRGAQGGVWGGRPQGPQGTDPWRCSRGSSERPAALM